MCTPTIKYVDEPKVPKMYNVRRAQKSGSRFFTSLHVWVTTPLPESHAGADVGYRCPRPPCRARCKADSSVQVLVLSVCLTPALRLRLPSNPPLPNQTPHHHPQPAVELGYVQSRKTGARTQISLVIDAPNLQQDGGELRGWRLWKLTVGLRIKHRHTNSTRAPTRVEWRRVAAVWLAAIIETGSRGPELHEGQDSQHAHVAMVALVSQDQHTQDPQK
ncbi:hypothetical protein B0H11DRAFT_1944370 [Mycena galericulata]|nr:hypothetical protein B0H11DRAFT_1944370 [Mycena galericulata]